MRVLFRPAEVDLLVGHPEKARAKLGWHHSIQLEELVREMVNADCSALGIKSLSGPMKVAVTGP